MKRLAVILLLMSFAVPAFCKTHQENYSVPCTTLWSAVRDTLRNSGKYGIISMDSTEMIATYTMGMGSAGQKRTNQVVLNAKGDNACEMQVQSGFSGLGNNDAGDFKKRVDQSLAKQAAAPAPPAKADAPKSEAPK
jgi:hypothetical protein